MTLSSLKHLILWLGFWGRFKFKFSISVCNFACRFPNFWLLCLPFYSCCCSSGTSECAHTDSPHSFIDFCNSLKLLKRHKASKSSKFELCGTRSYPKWDSKHSTLTEHNATQLPHSLKAVASAVRTFESQVRSVRAQIFRWQIQRRHERRSFPFVDLQWWKRN